MEQPELNENEEIRDVPGYEGVYMITNHGRAWSCGREIESTNRWGPCISYIKGKWLKPGLNNYGYRIVMPCKNGKHKCMTIHRLVAEAFIQNPSNLLEINHIDGNKINNHISNLEWVTRQQNKNHAIETRLCSPNRSSEYHGVCWNKKDRKWAAQIKIKGNKYYIGYFDDELKAAKAWDMFLNKHNITERLFNFPKEIRHENN